jgi:hypothetical protein
LAAHCPGAEHVLRAHEGFCCRNAAVTFTT